MSLTPESIQRYQRQLLLAPIGGAGQERLFSASLLLHGDAPLAATYMAAAGLGTLLVTGAEPAIATHDPAFRMNRVELDAAADLVLDLGDGSAYAAAIGDRLWGGRLWGGVAEGQLLLGCEPRVSVAGRPQDRALLEVLAAGEALWRLLGREPHSYAFSLRCD